MRRDIVNTWIVAAVIAFGYKGLNAGPIADRLVVGMPAEGQAPTRVMLYDPDREAELLEPWVQISPNVSPDEISIEKSLRGKHLEGGKLLSCPEKRG